MRYWIRIKWRDGSSNNCELTENSYVFWAVRCGMPSQKYNPFAQGSVVYATTPTGQILLRMKDMTAIEFFELTDTVSNPLEHPDRYGQPLS